MSTAITQHDVDCAQQVLRDVKERSRVLRSDMDQLLAYESLENPSMKTIVTELRDFKKSISNPFAAEVMVSPEGMMLMELLDECHEHLDQPALPTELFRFKQADMDAEERLERLYVQLVRACEFARRECEELKMSLEMDVERIECYWKWWFPPKIEDYGK